MQRALSSTAVRVSAICKCPNAQILRLPRCWAWALFACEEGLHEPFEHFAVAKGTVPRTGSVLSCSSSDVRIIFCSFFTVSQHPKAAHCPRAYSTFEMILVKSLDLDPTSQSGELQLQSSDQHCGAENSTIRLTLTRRRTSSST